MYKLRTSCRACGLGGLQPSTLKQSTAAGDAYKGVDSLIPVFDLGVQPLANDFVGVGDEHAGFAPLKVLFCPRCHLGQLSVEVDPRILYAHNYPYVTSTSETMKEHFKLLNEGLKKECKVHRSVVEIGSNDGLLLEFLLANGWKTALGIDPADNLAKIAQAKGIVTLPQFFNAASAATARQSVGHPDLILARHCFCHVNDWQGFVKALEVLAGDDTVIAIEVPWAQDMLEKREFDTVYHEHTSYLSLQSIEFLLRDSSLGLADVWHYDIHGGAVLLIIRKRGFNMGRNLMALSQEKISLDMWRSFANASEVKIVELGGMVRNLVAQGKTVVGYGASAKSTVWINACQFTRKEIKFITDNTKGKWYKLLPGTQIPVVDEGAILRELPDYAIIYCWNYLEEVLRNNKLYLEKGGKFIVPSPTIRVIDYAAWKTQKDGAAVREGLLEKG